MFQQLQAAHNRQVFDGRRSLSASVAILTYDDDNNAQLLRVVTICIYKTHIILDEFCFELMPCISSSSTGFLTGVKGSKSRYVTPFEMQFLSIIHSLVWKFCRHPGFSLILSLMINIILYYIL